MAAPKFLKGGKGQMQPMSRALRPGMTEEASAPKSKPFDLGKFKPKTPSAPKFNKGGVIPGIVPKGGIVPKIPKIK